jgi:tetratricopeptide (TPR) repeat protein
MCATDVLIDCKSSKQETSHLPWHLTAAASCGVKLLLTSGSVTDDWLPKEIGTRMESFSSLDLMNGLHSLFSTGSFAVEVRMAFAVACRESFEAAMPIQIICDSIGRLCGHDDRTMRRETLKSFIDNHQIPVTYKSARDVLLTCEEIRDFSATLDFSLHSEVLRIRGDALVALSRNEEALLAFESSLKANSTNYQALRGLGFLAWQGYSHEDALSFFKRGLGVNPNDYQCLVGVGLVYRRLKMFDEAAYWLKSAVAIGGLESPSLSLLVQACLENSEEPKALEVLNSVMEVMGEHPTLLTAIQKIESHQ